MSDVIHHPGHMIEEVDWYEPWFDRGRPGDWLWSSETIDGVTHRTITMIVPLVPPDYRSSALLAARGGEMLRVFVRRAADDWSQPGPVDAWDGNEENPTLTGSIYCRGLAEVKGWHGFFVGGQLVNLDGSIVGVTP